MMPVLEFIFSSFWTWLGTFLLVCAVGNVFARVIQAPFGRDR